jgi:hydrogenase expression/formation protein HypC
VCLAVPGKIISIKGNTAAVDIEGVTTEADISLLDNVEVGDYVIIHTGFAIQRYDEEDALETLRLLKEMSDSAGF